MPTIAATALKPFPVNEIIKYSTVVDEIYEEILKTSVRLISHGEG